jgi:putative ABC transport system permease protein
MTALPHRGWALPFRLARRNAMRARRRSVLMLVMIALPVLGVTTADVLLQTALLNRVERLDRDLGTVAAAEVSVQDAPVSPVAQSIDPFTGGSGSTSSRTRLAPDLAQVLAAIGGRRTGLAIDTTADINVTTTLGRETVPLHQYDVTSPLANGLATLRSGRWPRTTGEVVITPDLAANGPRVGGTLTGTVQTQRGVRKVDLRVVGLVDDASYRHIELAIGIPGTVVAGGDPSVAGTRTWLIGGGPVDWSAVQRVNALGALVLSRAVVEHPSPAALAADRQYAAATGPAASSVALAGLVAVMVLIEVALLAGPSFAVGARQQSRDLALLAAAGATPRQLRRTVLGTSVVLGITASVFGVAVGIPAARLLQPLAQRLDGTWFGPFEIPWLHLLGVVGFGLLSAVLAGIVPAWIAAHQDVVAVLAGRRGDRAPRRRNPILGAALLIAGAGVTVVGAPKLSTVGTAMTALGAILVVLGMLFLIPGVVVLVARAMRSWPFPLRFAARDSSRHRTRTVPAVAAVAATVAGVVAFTLGAASGEKANRDAYSPSLPVGTASVGTGDLPVGEGLSNRLVASIGGIVRDEVPAARLEVAHALVAPTSTDGTTYEDIAFVVPGTDRHLEPSAYQASFTGIPVSTGGTWMRDLAPYRALDESRAARVLAQGGVVVFGGPTGLQQVTVARERSVNGGTTKRLHQITVPVYVVPVGPRDTAPAQAIVSPRIGPALGLTAQQVGVFVDGAPISTAAESRIQQRLNGLAATPGFYVERGYQPSGRTKVIEAVIAALGLLLMLAGTLTATFLSLADARPDLATLGAVGAAPRTRRVVAASYALVIGSIGSVLGVLVGFVPGTAAAYAATHKVSSCPPNAGPDGCAPHTGLAFLDVPWTTLLLVVVGLPLLISLVVGLSARSRLPMVARVA